MIDCLKLNIGNLSSRIEVIYLPPFSKLLDIAYENFCLNIIYEYNFNLASNLDKKIYHIMICDYINNVNDFQYLGKIMQHEIIIPNYISESISYISESIKTYDKIYYILFKEIKSSMELRNDKINVILSNN